MSPFSARRIGLVAALSVVACVTVGCGSNQWSSEITARIDGVTASLRAALEATGPTESKEHDFAAFRDLGRELLFKSDLIEELKPPKGCEEVQEKVHDHVQSTGLGSYGAGDPKNFTPALFPNARNSLRQEISRLEGFIRDAETCAET